MLAPNCEQGKARVLCCYRAMEKKVLSLKLCRNSLEAALFSPFPAAKILNCLASGRSRNIGRHLSFAHPVDPSEYYSVAEV